MKKKLIIAIITLIIILLLAFLVIFLRNYVLLKDIVNKNYSLDNFKYVMTSSYSGSSTDSKIPTYFYKKGDIVKQISKNNSMNTTLELWNDMKSKESITLLPDKKTAIKSSNELISVKIPSIEYALGSLEDLNLPLFCMSTIIKCENVGDIECIVLSDSDDTYYIDKNTGFLVKNEKYEEANNSTYTVEYSDIEIGTVSDEDIAKPDLSGYTVNEQ